MEAMPGTGSNSVRVSNPGGESPIVLICDHASNHIPDEFGSLGLEPGELTRHIAWDPGAAPVAQRMSAALDAALVESSISRLVIDCNRSLEAPDLVPELGEATLVPGNIALSAEALDERVALAWRPFHNAIEQLIRDRLRAGRETRLVSIHSFTPCFLGTRRPWQVGVIHDDDMRMARPLIAALRAADGLVVGVNEPYSPADRVYYTLERHARSRGLPCVMIEIRNDVIDTEQGQRRWADMLASILLELEPERDRQESPQLRQPAQPVN
jgi:predicted N-formylglutamate amidohydrolase